MAEFDIGQAITSTATFRDPAGVATDPTTVTATLLAPDGTSTSPAITNGGVGIRSVTFTPSVAGTWVVTWTGTGAVADREYGVYVVRPGYAWDPLAILTLDEAKRAINIATSNTDHDAELYTAVVAMSRAFDAKVGPVVIRTVTDEVHTGGGRIVFPRLTPIAEMTTVTEYSSGTAQVLTAETVAAATSYDYRLTANGHNVQLARRSSYSDATFAATDVVLVYEAGRYESTATVDQRFKAAAQMAMRRWWKREAGAWAQSPGAFGDLADGGDGFVGFFRIVDPIVDEMLADERLPPAVG